MVALSEETSSAGKSHYLSLFENLEKRRGKQDPKWLGDIRTEAIGQFEKLGFPTLRHEEWKYTDVRAIRNTPFQLVDPEASLEFPALKIQSFLLGNDDWPRLVFVNGVYAEKFSSLSGLPEGVQVLNLKNAIASGVEVLKEHLTHHVRFDQSGFAALNAAFIQDGALIYVPKTQFIDKPIHLIYVNVLVNGRSEKLLSQPRNLIVAGEASGLTIVESHVAVGEEMYFSNPVTEIALGKGAALDYYKFERESTSGLSIATTQVNQERDSHMAITSLNFGAKLSRNTLNVRLEGEGAECLMDGLYVTRRDHHVDNTTYIKHAKPHCKSRQLYKGVLDGASTTVFYGKIYVEKDAQKTDASQTNKNLLLSGQATADTRPQLEIYADDVKCTHGAAVGQPDQESIFYLQSRGIGTSEARSLLTYGFAEEVVSRIKLEPLRQEIETLLIGRLGTHDAKNKEGK